jgi:DNA ligase (NAD+)
LYRLIYGLGIPHGGVEIAKNIANNFASLQELSSAIPENLLTINLVGDTIANAVHNFFCKPKYQKMLERMKTQGP